MKRIFTKTKEFLLDNEQKIVLFIGFVLISAISFGFGVLQGQKTAPKPLIIEKQADVASTQEIVKDGASGSAEGKQADTSQGSQQAQNSGQTGSTKDCAFVGSKNSDKFYVPSCSFAKRVKPENLACYKTEQEALAKGKTKSDCK